MKKYFITGLVTLLPLAVTTWVVHFFMNFLTKPFIGFVYVLTNQIPIASPQLIRVISQICILITLVIFTWFLGFVARKFFFNHLIRFGDAILIKIPLVNKVYKTSKEIVSALFGAKEKSFKQVVLLPFPYQGSYCIGLITRDAPHTCSEAEKSELLSVFIPTTPNPSTGFLVMSNRSELINLDMSTEEAIKYVVSCAVIQPEEKK
ncbi:MAG: hypothetical protein COT85_02735 [Chlamydiae bacterium CG10_big_fil_rev_8_21_14_0_10_42_34]|nr:MAG: hypothetical protein COT85_02735 [Chlamydiae bacterium CG10_big_fil_rev_8_21_14_0_10_42_34]